MPDVQHDESAHAFSASVDGGDAMLEYQRDGDRIVFTHTFVPESARGQDIGTALVEAGMAYARAESLTVVPQCPFVAAYVESHPQAQDLV